MAITQRTNRYAQRGFSGRFPRIVRVVAVVGTGLTLGLLFTQLGYITTAMIFIGLAAVAVAVLSPYWALVIAVAQWAFIPSEGAFFSIETTPNQLQFIGPLLVISALIHSLKERAHDRLEPRLLDFAIGGLGVWGYAGMLLQGHSHFKWYTNRMVLPMLFYYTVRLVKLTRERVRKLLAISLGAVGIQSLLMIRESMAGSSPIYVVRRGLVQGVKAAAGPFLVHWNAAIFLAIWPSQFIYMIAHAKGKRRKGLWAMGLLVVLIATTRTMQRAATLASLIAIVLCLLPSQLRRTTTTILLVLALAYIPWSMGSAGGALMDRYDQTDESRYARRQVALDLLKSDRWNPIYGLGWSRGHDFTAGLGTQEEILVWGSRRTTLADFSDTPLHNVWLQIPVELGGVGALFTLAIILSAVTASIRILRRARERPVDTGLLVALWGSLIAIGAIGYFQHVWHTPAAMSVMWMIYGIIVSKPHVFDIDDTESAP